MGTKLRKATLSIHQLLFVAQADSLSS